MALRACLIAAVILAGAALIGDRLLRTLSIIMLLVVRRRHDRIGPIALGGAGGKRLRPLLVLLCAGADGGEESLRAARNRASKDIGGMPEGTSRDLAKSEVREIGVGP